MENASKALLIGAGVLLAILILNVATRMFHSASEVTETYDNQMQSTETRGFNANFTKYYGAPKEGRNYTTICNNT